MSLPFCHSRKPCNDTAGVFFCAHPKVHSNKSLVSYGFCSICDLWKRPPPENPKVAPTVLNSIRERPCFHLGERKRLEKCSTCRGNIQTKIFHCHHIRREETSYKQCERCLEYEPELKTAHAVKTWAVGMTTAPRSSPTLHRTLVSAEAAGWSDIRLFAEPGSRIPEDFAHLSVTWRESTLGPWANWLLGLHELSLRNPTADAVMMLQDDVVFCRDLRRFIEPLLWPARRLGMLSLYTPEAYEKPGKGLQLVDTSRGIIGALAMVFPAMAVRCVLSSEDLLKHHHNKGNPGWAHVDESIGRWAFRERLPVYCHFPSLAQHIGKTSTIWQDDEFPHTRRQANDFPGEAMHLL